MTDQTIFIFRIFVILKQVLNYVVNITNTVGVWFRKPYFIFENHILFVKTFNSSSFLISVNSGWQQDWNRGQVKGHVTSRESLFPATRLPRHASKSPELAEQFKQLQVILA